MHISELKWIDRNWQCSVSAEGWPELSQALVWFEPAKRNDDSQPIFEQEAALGQFLENATNLRPLVHEALQREHTNQLGEWIEQGVDKGLVEKAIAEDIVSVTTLKQVIIWYPRECGTLIGLDFDWKYDEEHGLGALLLSDTVLETRAAEVAHPVSICE
jgi:hypothetical protein